MNFNYGFFLEEAIQSVLSQTLKPARILVIDDASEDYSIDVIKKYDGVVDYVINAETLGIKENFNRSINLVSSKYAVFLDADNIMQWNFLEECFKILASHPEAVICYTDMYVFGRNAAKFADEANLHPLNGVAKNPAWLWHFPTISNKSQYLELQTSNFIHGNSIFSVARFKEVGGVPNEKPEDHKLWLKMLEGSNYAVNVAIPLLGYRKHSSIQAQDLLVLKTKVAQLYERIFMLEENQASNSLSFKHKLRLIYIKSPQLLQKVFSPLARWINSKL